MSKKQDAFLENLLERGIVDNRKLSAGGNAKRLPNGEYGYVLMCLKDHTLNIYDTDFSQNVGDLLYCINLRDVTDLKISTFIFNCYIKFTYQGFKYRIENALHKQLYAAVKKEAGVN